MTNSAINSFNIAEYRNSLKDQNHYARELRAVLPKHVFKPVPQRLAWLFIHLAIIITCAILIYKIDSILLNIVLSIIIGHSLGCNFFLGHEITHGCVIKNKKLIIFFSSICFAPWGLHGRAWINAHNSKHHQNTQNSINDPDCFGSKKYRYNKILQRLNIFLPGSGSLLSFTFLFWFFTFYTLYMVRVFTPNIFTNKKDKIISTLFFVMMYTIWPLVSFLIMPFGFIYFFLIPVLISNFLVMSYISTNHFLNPLTEEVNDPLVNALTVKTSKISDFFHLNFSYHVEHHIFPYVSPKYAPMIAAEIKKKYPHLYNEMPHHTALKLLYQRPKFYYDDVTLINPKTRQRYPTIILDDII